MGHHWNSFRAKQIESSQDDQRVYQGKSKKCIGMTGGITIKIITSLYFTSLYYQKCLLFLDCATLLQTNPKFSFNVCHHIWSSKSSGYTTQRDMESCPPTIYKDQGRYIDDNGSIDEF